MKNGKLVHSTFHQSPEKPIKIIMLQYSWWSSKRLPLSSSKRRWFINATHISMENFFHVNALMSIFTYIYIFILCARFFPLRFFVPACIYIFSAAAVVFSYVRAPQKISLTFLSAMAKHKCHSHFLSKQNAIIIIARCGWDRVYDSFAMLTALLQA